MLRYLVLVSLVLFVVHGDFEFTSGREFIYLGDATHDNDSCLRLTDSNRGAVYYNTKQHLDGFQVDFTYKLSDFGHEVGGGLAFVIQAVDSQLTSPIHINYPAEPGNMMGYAFEQCVTLEFDIRQNLRASYPKDNHVTLHVTSASESKTLASADQLSFDLSEDGVEVRIVILYTGAPNHHWEVYALSRNNTQTPILTIDNLPLYSMLGNTQIESANRKGWIGFMGTNTPSPASRKKQIVAFTFTEFNVDAGRTVVTGYSPYYLDNQLSTFTFRLVNADNVPLTSSGSLRNADVYHGTSCDAASILDHGDGSYSVFVAISRPCLLHIYINHPLYQILGSPFLFEHTSSDLLSSSFSNGALYTPGLFVGPSDLVLHTIQQSSLKIEGSGGQSWNGAIKSVAHKDTQPTEITVTPVMDGNVMTLALSLSIGEAPVIFTLPPGASEGSVLLNITTTDGSTILVSVVPPEENVRIQLAAALPPSNQTQLASLVLHIQMFDQIQNEISTFHHHPVTLCFSSEAELETSCLAFYSEEDSKWKCEDETLKSNHHLLCGNTPHFTNFAILLGAVEHTIEEYIILANLASGLVLIAIIIVVFVSILKEIQIRKRRKAIDGTMERVRSNHPTLGEVDNLFATPQATSPKAPKQPPAKRLTAAEQRAALLAKN